MLKRYFLSRRALNLQICPILMRSTYASFPFFKGPVPYCNVQHLPYSPGIQAHVKDQHRCEDKAVATAGQATLRSLPEFLQKQCRFVHFLTPVTSHALMASFSLAVVSKHEFSPSKMHSDTGSAWPHRWHVFARLF